MRLPQRPRGSEAEARPFLQTSLDDAVDALERPRRDDEQRTVSKRWVLLSR